MLRRTSLSFRVTRALIAPLTVWCLGCSGFDPIVDALAGGAAGSGMKCEAVERADVTSLPTFGTDTATAAESSEESVRAADDAGFDCGCGQACHGASPVEIHAAPDVRAALRVASVDSEEPPAVVHAPLLPPPQRLA